MLIIIELCFMREKTQNKIYKLKFYYFEIKLCMLKT